MSTKVLVTGANGQLGLTIKEIYEINNKDIDLTFVTKNELDIIKKQELNQYFKVNHFDYCINCAAYTNVEQAEKTPDLAFNVNAEGVKYLTEACKESQTILIHISTDYVFDGKKEEPYTENDKTNPINEYGKSKLLGEKYIQETLNDYFIIRTSWLYSKYEGNFLKTIISKIKSNSKLQIITSQKGTPTSCEQLSKFIFFLIKSKEQNFGIYHFSSQGETTWYYFALQIAKHFINYDNSNVTPIESFKSKATRPKYSVLNNDKAQLIFQKLENWQKSVDNTVIKLLQTK